MSDSRFIWLLCPLSIQWPDLSRRILDDPFLAVFFSWNNLCFKLFLFIAETSSFYLRDSEFAHLLLHLSVAICVFAFFKSDIDKSILGGRWVASLAATFANESDISFSYIRLCAGKSIIFILSTQELNSIKFYLITLIFKLWQDSLFCPITDWIPDCEWEFIIKFIALNF